MFQLVSLVVSFVLATSSMSAAAIHESDRDAGPVQRLSRYQISIPRARHDQRDRLVAVIDIELSDEVETVGAAIAAVINGSGYRLDTESPAACQQGLFGLPLPSVHRKLGPLSLRQALEVLSGPAYRPVIDPASRSVSFERVPPAELPDERGCGCE